MTGDKPLIGFIGLTHLAINTATAVSDRGFCTVWYSDDQERISSIENGDLGIVEPDLDGTFIKNRERIKVTSDIMSLNKCDIVYVAVDVPTDDRGLSDLAEIEALIGDVVPNLADATVLVILSQVPPGFTRKIPHPGNKLIYQVETLIFGQALARAMYPERYIIGVEDPETDLPKPYHQLLKAFECPILKMRYESAELAKISINCCLVSMVSTANTLSEICEGVGGDWAEIIPALKLDRRIGQYSYLSPGLGISGGNLERDLSTVRGIGLELGAHVGVIDSWISSSTYSKDWAYRKLERYLLSKQNEVKVTVLGLAYKANTHSIKNSPALTLLDSLEGKSVSVFDPIVDGEIVPFAKSSEDPLTACVGADAVAIMTPWEIFRDLDPFDIATAMRGNLILDPFSLLDRKSCADAGLNLQVLGTDVSN